MHVVAGRMFGVFTPALTKIFVQGCSTALRDRRKKIWEGGATPGGDRPGWTERRIHGATVRMRVGFVSRSGGHGLGYAQTESRLINAV